MRRIHETASFKANSIFTSNFCGGIPAGGSIWVILKTSMSPPHHTTSIESVAIAFLLLVASACIPLCLYVVQQETEHEESIEELAASAAGRVAAVAIRIRRKL